MHKIQINDWEVTVREIIQDLFYDNSANKVENLELVVSRLIESLISNGQLNVRDLRYIFGLDIERIVP